MDVEKLRENYHGGLCKELPHEEAASASNDIPTYDDIETAKVLRKVDWRLVPILALLYLMSFLDRGNIGNAKVAGMNEDLSLTSPQYNIVLTVS